MRRHHDEHDDARAPHDPSHRGTHHTHEPAHSDEHEHEQEHEEHRGRLAWLAGLLPFRHSHSHDEIDASLETSERGIWALKVSLLLLAGTAVLQMVVFAISGSVALLTDTVHNLGDALTAVPLWVAFILGRRPANKRYTYGYGRAEDIASLIILGVIVASALFAGYESVRRLIDPRPLDHIEWVLAAGVIGFIGNEAAAIVRIRVGREIGSAALIADGQHARVDGLTSLGVVLAALGVLAGFQLADPLVGLAVTATIAFIVKDTAVSVWRRLMDSVDPELVSGVEDTANEVDGVMAVDEVRVRWIGHRLHAELQVFVDEDSPTKEGHRIAEAVRHALFHSEPRLATINVHVDPCGHGGDAAHSLTEHHRTDRGTTGRSHKATRPPESFGAAS